MYAVLKNSTKTGMPIANPIINKIRAINPKNLNGL